MKWIDSIIWSILEAICFICLGFFWGSVSNSKLSVISSLPIPIMQEAPVCKSAVKLDVDMCLYLTKACGKVAEDAKRGPSWKENSF